MKKVLILILMCLLLTGCEFFQNRIAYTVEQKVIQEISEDKSEEESLIQDKDSLPKTDNAEPVVEDKTELQNEKNESVQGKKTEQKDNDEKQDLPFEDIVPVEMQILKERKWTILVYMCGDNNLEGAAINDIFEMETSNLDTDEINVLMLVDRNPSYSSSDDNWTETRLYRLQTGRGNNQPCGISKEIDCKNLGLICGTDTELDMSDGNTLSSALSFCYSKFPASNYGLIMWGHGNGWKGNDDFEIQNYKGFSYDETSNSYLTLRQFGEALKNSQKDFKLDFIGFDTCYGGELEIMYEIRNYAKYACGSEGLISSSGWNYNKLFNDIQASEDKSALKFLSLIKNQFEDQYIRTSRASFVACNLESIENYFKSFDKFMAEAGRRINTPQERDYILQCIYASPYCKTERYSYGKEGYDVYLDCVSMCENLLAYFCNSEMNDLFNTFYEAVQNCVVYNWASDREAGGLGVYFQTLGAGGLLLSNYDSNYIKGKTYNQIDFVQHSEGYVPTVAGNRSFIDKLFY